MARKDCSQDCRWIPWIYYSPAPFLLLEGTARILLPNRTVSSLSLVLQNHGTSRALYHPQARDWGLSKTGGSALLADIDSAILCLWHQRLIRSESFLHRVHRSVIQGRWPPTTPRRGCGLDHGKVGSISVERAVPTRIRDLISDQSQHPAMQGRVAKSSWGRAAVVGKGNMSVRSLKQT